LWSEEDLAVLTPTSHLGLLASYIHSVETADDLVGGR